MADNKTHLRELIFLYWVIVKVCKLQSSDIPLPTEVINVCLKYVENISLADNINHFSIDSIEYHYIVKNGLLLATEAIRVFNISKIDRIERIGREVHNNLPVDVIVNGLAFSLKEDSFILENMGLYKLLSLLTGNSFQRGTHIFLKFGLESFVQRFDYVFSKLLSVESWKLDNGRYFSAIYKEGNNTILNYNDEEKFILNGIIGYKEYSSNTSGIIREKVVSKRIGDQLKNDETYNKLKKVCSESAGREIVKYLNANIDYTYSGLLRFLQVYDDEYYYCKVSNGKPEIYRIPAKNDIINDLSIDEIMYSVPNSQLNLLTTIKNTATGGKIKIRNEIRYSHGQLNGTPEAKLYYDSGSSLEVIYEKLK